MREGFGDGDDFVCDAGLRWHFAVGNTTFSRWGES